MTSLGSFPANTTLYVSVTRSSALSAEYLTVNPFLPAKHVACTQFTVDFTPVTNEESSSQTTTPTTSTMPLPLQPQLTGPYFASLRQTLLGGKNLNRFSNFVTSGAEDWILHGDPEEEESSNDDHLRPPRRGHDKDSTYAGSETGYASDEGRTKLKGPSTRHFIDVSSFLNSPRLDI